ncbi:MAG: transcriptional regulator [Alphaproteobacteria bacterium]|nr:MAG: transcriptional regulator [Alphaproteobacteria bacterium]
MVSLYEAILLLRNEKECRDFMRDLCTPGEIKDMEERWQIAQILNQGEMSYREIQKKIGASVTTVGRVARFLKDEPYQGYRTILNRLSE